MSQGFIRAALLAGTLAAVVAGMAGFFVVIRRLTFAADALTHVGFAGASGGVVLGLSPVIGLLSLTGLVAIAIGLLEQRLRGRDVVIGMVLVEALGLGVLFLRLSTGSYSNQTYALLFGDILNLSARDLTIMGVAAVIAVIAIVVMFRPLLLASFDDEVAEARGVPVRGLAVAFLLVMALVVTATTQVIGALLAVALIAAPAASAHRITHRPGRAIALAVGLAIAIVWTSIAAAYWVPYPVSFFVTSLCAVVYGASRLVRRGHDD